MFEYIKQNDRPNGLRYVASLLLSVTTHAAILGLIVTVPMIFCNALRPDVLTWLKIDPIHFPNAVPPTPSFRSASPHADGTGKRPAISNIGFIEPTGTPDRVIPEPPVSDPFEGGLGEDGGGIGLSPGVAEGPGNAVSSIIAQFKNEKPIPLPIPIKRQPTRSILVVSAIQASKLIHKVTPVYPELARRARVSGTVTLMALIDEDGSVSGLKVLSGHTLLINAACDAVRQWKYSPTILNGEPVPVQATVNVIFAFQ
jgi:periplasmic protein TonB